MAHTSEPRMTVAFAMFCREYDPATPTDLRQMTTGLGGWRADAIPTVDLTLAMGLWNAGGPGQVKCRLGVRRPDDEMQYIGEGDTIVSDVAEMVILPLKFQLTFDRPGTYWAVCEFGGDQIVEVPFTVTEEPAPTMVLPS